MVFGLSGRSEMLRKFYDPNLLLNTPPDTQSHSLDTAVDAGDDCLDGGRGNDQYTGGTGNDAFVIFGNSDADTITDYTISEDVIVDMTGSASAKWVKGSKKDDIASVCVVTSSGNNSMTIEGITSSNDCNNVDIR